MTNYEIHTIENKSTNQVYVKYHYENRNGVSLSDTYNWALNEIAKGNTKDYVNFVANSSKCDLKVSIEAVDGSGVLDAKLAKVEKMNELENQGFKVINPQRG